MESYLCIAGSEPAARQKRSVHRDSSNTQEANLCKGPIGLPQGSRVNSSPHPLLSTSQRYYPVLPTCTSSLPVFWLSMFESC